MAALQTPRFIPSSQPDMEVLRIQQSRKRDRQLCPIPVRQQRYRQRPCFYCALFFLLNASFVVAFDSHQSRVEKRELSFGNIVSYVDNLFDEAVDFVEDVTESAADWFATTFSGESSDSPVETSPPVPQISPSEVPGGYYTYRPSSVDPYNQATAPRKALGSEEDGTLAPSSFTDVPSPSPTDFIFGQQAASCSANSACLVFPGNCCPNSASQRFECCDGIQPTGIINDLLLFEQGNWLGALDGFTIDVTAVEVLDLAVVAIIPTGLLVSGVRFTLADFPPILVAPREGVFVLGPLGESPISLDDIVRVNGSFQVTATALDSDGNDVGGAFVASVTIVGVDEPRSEPIVSPGPTTSSPTSRPTDVPSLQPVMRAVTSNPSGTFTSSTTLLAAACSAHPTCPQVPGVCCPTAFGAFYPCCFDGSVVDDRTSSPTTTPSEYPFSTEPSGIPVREPSKIPSVVSSVFPTTALTSSPTEVMPPVGQPAPTKVPTSWLSQFPTKGISATSPGSDGSSNPSATPTTSPGSDGSSSPSTTPTTSPVLPTTRSDGSSNSSATPTAQNPTVAPIGQQTASEEPTKVPFGQQDAPTLRPSSSLSKAPSNQPATGNPTRGPTTGNPTFVPSPFPTEPMTGTPTESPTPAPSPTPSAPPTDPIGGQQIALCSAYPSCLTQGLAGSCCPTTTGIFLACCQDNAFPTRSPVTTPVVVPTNSPTSLPIMTPTSLPTTIPTPFPSPQPTQAPTPAPTTPPTSDPTGTPTDFPTRDPVANPTPFPTLNPTNGPTVSPTRSPTVPPTMFPTLNPTTEPSATPSRSPTAKPTYGPTLTPTEQPSLAPSVSMSPTVSVAPSSVPTGSFEYEKQQFLRENVKLEFTIGSVRRYLEDEPDFCTESAKLKVQEVIAQELKRVIVSYERVNVNILDAQTETDESIVLGFDALIEIRSAVKVTNGDVDRFIEGPFDTEVEKQSFLEYMKQIGCFRSANTVKVIVPKASAPPGRISNGSPNASLIGLIAGLTIAAVAIILLGVLFIFLRARKHRVVDEEADATPLVLESAGGDNYYSEIDGGTNNDISTLGDPIPKGTQPNGDQDQSTLGSTSLEYDYKKAFQDQQSVTDSKVLGSMEGTMEGTSPFLTLATPEDPALAGMFGDAEEDTTVESAYSSEEQFEVVAPAGLLGLILESSLDDGRPKVNNVKASSVLASVVRIGDRLLSVDGEDVTKFSANQVSYILASKKDQSSRVMLFARSLRDEKRAEDISHVQE